MQPEKIGHYEIKSELGRGGMATVYKAYDPRFEREVAVKVLPPEMLHADPNFRLRFQREAKIIAQLEHPSIVPVYDVGEENNQPYFVMRYMNGGSLAERIKKSVYSIDDATRLLEHIAPGLDEAHAKGIVHRDLKPSNILFTAKEIPCISDFGIAKLSEAEAGNFTGSAIIGTPAYMSPEQAAGNAVDHRTDIYALGIILYEMVTGRQPYKSETPMGLALKHITEPVPSILEARPDLPAWMEEVISSAMAKDPNDRYSSAQQLVDALQSHLNDETVARITRREPKPVKPSPVAKTAVLKKRRFNPTFLIIILLVLGLIGALTVGGLMASGWMHINWTSDTPTAEPVLPTATSPATEEILPTETSLPSVTETAAPVLTDSPTPTARPAGPLGPIVGGADKIALLSGNDIWIMNVDGSEPKRLTTDGVSKLNLEWIDRNTILYISGKTLKTVDIETLREENITSFLSSEYFESFHVSPDGTQAAISLDRELFVIPFDLEKLRSARSRADLMDLDGCLFYDAYATKDALWADDGNRLALKILVPAGNQRADAIRLMDIQNCSDAPPKIIDDFPIGRFDFKHVIVDYDYDGDQVFFFHSDIFKGGFGELVFYSSFTHKFQKIFPVENTCCYRDVTFSPDHSHVIFAFQDIRQGEQSVLKVYYVPVEVVLSGKALKPLLLPEGFFSQRIEAPMFALRPVEK
ncbi:MAG: serine/threonine protein kinase [Chloroflexi bacterium]|nr:serine/threonine protein kinase [Chloroflexota bacterium]